MWVSFSSSTSKLFSKHQKQMCKRKCTFFSCRKCRRRYLPFVKVGLTAGAKRSSTRDSRMMAAAAAAVLELASGSSAQRLWIWISFRVDLSFTHSRERFDKDEKFKIHSTRNSFPGHTNSLPLWCEHKRNFAYRNILLSNLSLEWINNHFF